MARKRRDELEQAIQQVLAPGAFVGYQDSWEFVKDVEAVRGKIAPLMGTGEAPRAVALLETFIAGCYEKSEEIDDSSGSFGQLVEQLFCDWIRARQAANAEPSETAETLLSWMEDDDYGYCYRLEAHAVKAFDKAGLSAFERAVRSRMAVQDTSASPHRRSVEMLKAVFTKRRDVTAYADLCELKDGLAPKDCETLAEMCLKRRRHKDALAWVERGLELELEKKNRWPNRSAWRLPDLRRSILQKVGRAGDALASAWEDYRQGPSPYSYEDLMKFVPRGKRAEWHAKAIATLGDADLSSRIEILVMTREWSRVAEVIESAAREDLMALSHYTMEPVVKKLGRSHPLLVAKLRIAMGLRIVEAKKSKYYDVALGHFETARDILTKQERADEWDHFVAEVRERHGRKYGFMPGFVRLVEGHRSSNEPSFLDRARQRWKNKARGRSSP